jgi:hypothetical protein
MTNSPASLPGFGQPRRIDDERVAVLHHQQQRHFWARNAAMALRWTAAGMMDAVKMVRRMRADRERQSMAIDNRHDFRAGPAIACP